MKIKSLLLGSAAAVAMSPAVVAGGAPSLGDICNELDIIGVTISSTDTCLQISGTYDFEIEFNNYPYNSGTNDDELNFEVDVFEVTLGFLATQASDYGLAQFYLEFLYGGDSFADDNGIVNLTGAPVYPDVVFGEAWVSAAGFTAGVKSDLDDETGDEVFSYLGLRTQEDEDGLFDGSGDFASKDNDSEYHFLAQFTRELGTGIDVTVSLEDLDDTLEDSGPDIAAQIEFGGPFMFSGLVFAELSDIYGNTSVDSELNIRGILNFDIDDYGKVRLAAAYEDNADGNSGVDNWHVLASFETMIDVVTLAVSAEIAQVDTDGNDTAVTAANDTDSDFWSVGASVGFEVADGVELLVGGYYGDDDIDGNDWQAGIKANIDLADDLVLSLEALSFEENTSSVNSISSELTWEPVPTQTWNAKIGIDDDKDIFGEFGAAGSF